ncbi:hypothetical protein [Stenotrophomonas sepilia]|uniref:hypothetical protein n=1 Tax=Stenotrophomonas sepilia TaxID=2860290 RepID=UPI002E77AD8C|nr:hypothetical protein [Stenotrophomonas sepilia]
MTYIHPNDRVYALEHALAAAVAQGEDRKVQDDLREILAEARREAPGMTGLVLVPAPEDPGIPARMRQPTKDAYRQWLAQANERIEQLQAEIAELRDQGATTSAERDPLLAELIEAAASLGHYETLRSSPEETIKFWRAEIQRLRAALDGGIGE